MNTNTNSITRNMAAYILARIGLEEFNEDGARALMESVGLTADEVKAALMAARA